MIFEVEVPAFPPGVLLQRSHILDTVTGDRVPINETARLMLSLVDGRRTAKEIGEAVAAGYALAPRQVTSDFLQLVATLNEKYLLNLKTPLRSRCAALPRIVKLFLIGVVSGQVRPPWHRRRLDLCNESKLAGFLSVVRGLSPSAAVMGSTVSLTLWLFLGGVLPSVWMVVSIALAFALSLVLHEASHAMALSPVPAFLSVYGPVFLVGHREIPPKKGLLVSAAGPVITGVSGSLVVLMSGTLHSEHLVLVGEVLVMNLFGITTLAADGRKAVRNLALAADLPWGRGEGC